MPVDGYREIRHHEGWTIEVEPSPLIVARWKRWRGRWRGDYHKFTQGLIYEAVNAIQDNILHRRRCKLALAEGCARYFFRCDRYESNIIRITIERIDFSRPDSDLDPDPHGGEFALQPLEPLVVNVSGGGRRFSIDYVEGVWLHPPHTNRINRFILTYTAWDVRTSTHDTIGSPRFSSAELYRVNDDLVSRDY